MKVIQSYLQGARHKSKNQACEDRTYSLSKNGVTVIALADGAGSKKYTRSADGAECVTKTISKFFCNNFDKFYDKDDADELSTVIMTVCQRALKTRSVEIGVDDIVKMSSTLLVVAVKNNRMIACHIGDGVIGKLTSTGTQVISAPDNGEFASTTYFITNPKAYEHIQIIKDKTDCVISYFLMSDGTQEYVYDDVNKCFHDAVRKMALFPYSSIGQEKLEQTIIEYMINADPLSDDCSFICLLLEDEKSNAQIEYSDINEYLNPENISNKRQDIEFCDIRCEKLPIENRKSDFSVGHNSSSYKGAVMKEQKKEKAYLFALLILAIVIALMATIVFKIGKNDNVQEIPQSTTEENSESIIATKGK